MHGYYIIIDYIPYAVLHIPVIIFVTAPKSSSHYR